MPAEEARRGRKLENSWMPVNLELNAEQGRKQKSSVAEAARRRSRRPRSGRQDGSMQQYNPSLSGGHGARTSPVAFLWLYCFPANSFSALFHAAGTSLRRSTPCSSFETPKPGVEPTTRIGPPDTHTPQLCFLERWKGVFLASLCRSLRILQPLGIANNETVKKQVSAARSP